MVDVADALQDLAEEASDAPARPKAAAKLTLADIERLVAAESLDLPAAIRSYLAAPDVEPAKKPADFVSVDTLRRQLAAARRRRHKQQRKEASTEAWRKFMQQRALPERMKLADIVVALHESGSEASRALLVRIAREAPLSIGLWGGVKRVWKRAEQRFDVLLWAALTAAIEHNAGVGDDVGPGTRRYVSRRAWRTLRDLGRASPEMFPTAAAELLRHYTSWGTVISRVMYLRPSDPLYATWKTSPEPLWRLVEGAQIEAVARFAADALRKLHADALRALPPARLARLVEREPALSAAHELFLELVEKSPSLPKAKLREAGLHDAALALLFSPSQQARVWAVEYARAHADDLAVDAVVALVERGQGEVQQLGLQLLEPVPAATLDIDVLARLLDVAAAVPLVDKKLRARLDAVDEEARTAFLVRCALTGAAQAKFVSAGATSAEVWLRVLEDERCDNRLAELALRQLGAQNGGDPVAVVDAARLLTLVAHKPQHAAVVGALFDKAARANELDVERAKGLVFPSKTRAFALRVLGNRKLVRPLDLGLPWLLALAKRADPDLHRFAYATLLEHTRPEDFAPAAGGDGDAGARGVERLFHMATGAAESDNTRGFAQTYLRCHHPVLGPQEPQARQLGLSPQLSRDAFTLERLWPALFDPREDVRRFAASVARLELRRWGAQRRLAELCESDDRQVRNVALDAMLRAGDPAADPDTTLTLDELDAEVIFPLTESSKKSVRETGMELIRRHYARLGGVDRLAWLMQSAERDVRSFAVRLLWEKHRPRSTPKGWQPRAGVIFDDAGRFADGVAMRGFLRRVLLALPPGASPGGDDDKVRKHVPASVAKRRLVEVVRDIAVADAAFAAVVTPVLAEMTGSLAKGEWQACLAAVRAIESAHKSGGALALPRSGGQA